MSSAPESALVQRVLSRLERAEWHEPSPHLQADYRIAWITVLRASRGESAAHVSASYAVLGLHPEKVWPAILERRKALLGPLHENFYGDLAVARKPARSERSATSPMRAGRAA